MKILKKSMFIILFFIISCKLFLLFIGSQENYSKSKIIELLLPLFFIILLVIKNKYSWIILVISLGFGNCEIYFFSVNSSFFPMFLIINPILELIKHFGLNNNLFLIFFHLPSIFLPFSMVFMFSKQVRNYYGIRTSSAAIPTSPEIPPSASPPMLVNPQ